VSTPRDIRDAFPTPGNPAPGSVRVVVELEVRVEDLESFAKALVQGVITAAAIKHG